MLSIAHVVAGAAIGAAVSDLPGAPVVAFGLGWASHYVLDRIPHWERLYRHREHFSTQQPASHWPRHILVQAILDNLAAALIVSGMIQTLSGTLAFWRSPLFWGALGGVFPDLLDNTPFWNATTRNWPFFRQERYFHKGIHISQEDQTRYHQFGLLTQLIVVTLGLCFLLLN